MNTAKHTAGNWKVIACDRGWIITAKDGMYDVALVRDIGNEDNEANARLIAAAPNLAFQLLAAANYIDALGGDNKLYRIAYQQATGVIR